MTYLLLFVEFFKIGLFAIGGGLVTVPFLFDLSEKYDWFSTKELTDMIAVAESTPGPLGVNMATYAGFGASGILGAIIAVLGLVLPSVVIIIMVARLMDKYQCNTRVQVMLRGIRPAVLALIIFAGLELARIAVVDVLTIILFLSLVSAIRIWRKSPIFYLFVSAILGIVLQL